MVFQLVSIDTMAVLLNIVMPFLHVDHFFMLLYLSNPVVKNEGKIGSTKQVSLPGKKVDLPVLTEQDKHYLTLGVEQGVDLVFASFIQDKEDVLAVRDALGEKGRHILVISKVLSTYVYHDIEH